MLDIGVPDANKFTETVGFDNGIKLPFTRNIIWGNAQSINGDNLGNFNFVGTGSKLVVSATSKVSWGGTNQIGYVGPTFTINNECYVIQDFYVDGIQYMNATRIRNVQDPQLAQDVATKNYVDTHGTGGPITVSGQVTMTGMSMFPSGIIDNIVWSGPPSENEWTFSWNPAAYTLISMVCMGANPDPGSGQLLTIKTMDKGPGFIRVGTFAPGGAWDEYPFFYVSTFAQL
jgi:hypothetical protein